MHATQFKAQTSACILQQGYIILHDLHRLYNAVQTPKEAIPINIHLLSRAFVVNTVMDSNPGTQIY
jgi:hypothetical protein